MKRYLSLILCIVFVFCFWGCGNDTEGNTTIFSSEAVTSENTTEPTTDESTAEKAETTTAPDPSPMDIGSKRFASVYGKRTGTDKTYTGLEPLKEITLPIIDPLNSRGLNETEIQHSFGVSENGKPHSISVENQKLYEEYGAICYNTDGKKNLYLTFDCGYENGLTSQILDTLKEKNVNAAFFVTLDHVKSSPEIIARMINEGHIVGNHSTSHPNFSKISRTEMAEEIQTLDNYLRVHFGYSSPFFRFPEGVCSLSALDLVQNCGYKSVFWSSAYADWDENDVKGKQYAFDIVTSRLHPGCVLLLHAVSKDNAQALGDIIDYAHENGYTFKLL